jgi:hypothetical protein
MNAFYIISTLVLYGLTFICFFIPYRIGQKLISYIVGGTLFLLISLTFFGNYFVIFIWPVIVIIQIIFIVYWTFRAFNRKKTGLVVATILTFAFLLLLLQPWISDWTFNKKDVHKILAFHHLELRDDFKILENEAGGFRDYYETFTIQLSDNDYKRLTQTIITSKYFIGLSMDYSNPSAMYNTNNDTIDSENANYYVREYWTTAKMENGTFHFTIQLDKKSKRLSYIGSDE